MMRRLLLLAFLFLAPAANARPMLASADMREAIDLDGPWNWSVDPYRDGLSGFHGGEAAPGHRRYEDIDTTAAMRGDPKALYEYDMDRSPRVALPQSFVTHAPEMRWYNGLVWYQRHFLARVLQHETDHLNGFTIKDRKT
jgi:beta-glucuronidase